MHNFFRIILVPGLFIFSLLMAASILRVAQPSEGLRDVSRVPVLVTNGVDVVALQAEDVERDLKSLPQRYAAPLDVDVTPQNSGIWESIEGQDVWRLRIKSPDAKSVSLGFTAYNMPESGNLTISSLDGVLIRGPFTASDNDQHGQYWTPLLESDELLLELRVDPIDRDGLELTLGRILHGYKSIESSITRSTTGSGSCNLDVVCGTGDGFPEVDGFRDQIRSVVVIGNADGLGCTGVLVNNSAEDFTPYLITADHCGFTDTVKAAALVVYWDFENPTCRQPNSSEAGGLGDGTLKVFNSGAYVRATHSPSDLTLLELDDPVPAAANAYYAGWDSTDTATSGAIGIHHPNSEEKRISFENDPTTLLNWETNSSNPILTHIRVNDWDIGTTEGGSSGSPLFSPEGLVIGVLEGGGAACGNDEAEYYGRIAHTWIGGGNPSNRLCDWLDPGGSCTLGTKQEGINAQAEGSLIIENPETDIVVTEVTGNGNGFYDPSETYSVEILLTNHGTGPAREISAAIRSSNCAVEIINDSVSFPDIAREDSQTSSEVLSFIIGNDCCGVTPEFIVTVTYENGLGSIVTYTHSFSLFVGQVVSTGVTITERYSSAEANIPDNDSGGVTLPLYVDSAYRVADLNVGLDISHPYVSDLKVLVTDPGGMSVMILDRPGIPATEFGCADESNINAILDDEADSAVEDECTIDGDPAISGNFTPNSPLSAFDGQAINGQWSITVIDRAGGDVGTVNDLELVIEEGVVQCTAPTKWFKSFLPIF